MEHRSDATGPKGRPPTTSKPRRRIPLILVATIIFVAFSPTLSSAGGEASQDAESEWEVKVIQPEVVSIVPHDSTAFTQGLEIHDGKFYESTGLYGESSVRIVNMSTGEIEVQHNLSDEYFGEGLTIWNDSVIQLTWRENTGFIYALETLEPISNFTYSGEGWGICQRFFEGDWGLYSDELYISNGSSQISKMFFNEEFDFLNTSINWGSYTHRDIIQVTYNGEKLSRLNELECTNTFIEQNSGFYLRPGYLAADGLYFANIWYDDTIVMFRGNGSVTHAIDISWIRSEFESEHSGVANGIAIDYRTGNLWITGKNWSNYYEISFDGYPYFFIIESESPPSISLLDSMIGSSVFGLAALPIILVVTVLLHHHFFRRIEKRQTEKPPRLSEDE